MQRDDTNPIWKQKSEKISPKNPPKASHRTTDLLSGRPPNHFQDGDLTFSLTASSVGGARPFTPDSASADQETL